MPLCRARAPPVAPGMPSLSPRRRGQYHGVQDAPAAATPPIYAGLFLVTLATLMYEVLLTRIFSVTMWYHFAFMAISVALFGMTVGALAVYVVPSRFPRDRVAQQLAWNALLFAAAIVASFTVHANIPVHGGRYALAGVLVPTYIVTAVPFALSGVCVTLALTRFPGQVSSLYAVDLAGAAAGCLLLIPLLGASGGPTAVIVIAAVAGIAAVLFAAETHSAGLKRRALASTIVLALLAAGNGVLAAHHAAPLRLTWVKGEREAAPIYEKWNSFSRIAVTGTPAAARAPIGWGLSAALPRGFAIPQLALTIDGGALTVITRFDGNLRRLEYLKYDVTNIAHYIRSDARVLVVGAGGGRDILSALVFNQKAIVAVDLNKNILDAVNGRFGEFSGHLDRNPRVTFVNDEARSYIARAPARYDIIQASLVDTAAATGAGAYVLAENSLYTVESWTLLLERLNPHGVLTVTRWFVRPRPAEMYRVTALAAAALGRLGVTHPREHLVILRAPFLPGADTFAAATILVSTAPFSARDLATLTTVAHRLRFDVVLSPQSSSDPMFAALASAERRGPIAGARSVNLTPPTDDAPFFFNMVRLQDIFHQRLWVSGTEYFNSEAVFILGLLLVLVAVLTLTCVAGPYLIVGRRTATSAILPLLLYFSSIGMGFMMIEISQMERLTIFLGHPTYGLSVVLCALLLSSGMGSLSTHRFGALRSARATGVRVSLLVAALCAFGAATPWALGVFRGAPTPERMLVAVLLLVPIGLFMGMAFPLGMKAAARGHDAATPWLWGINGATSVCASVVAVAVSMSAGISVSYWTGVAFYGIASGALGWAYRGTARRPGREGEGYTRWGGASQLPGGAGEPARGMITRSASPP